MHTAIDQQGRLQHVSEAQRGSACRCHCLSCGEPVIAKQGPKREWHFAHASDRPPCDINPESFLHRFVKQTIEEVAGVMVPPVPEGSALPGHFGRLFDGRWLNFERVDSEVPIGALRADLVGWQGQDQIVIEVAFSSFCGPEKIAVYEAAGLTVLEIDVSAFDSMAFDPNAARHVILTNLDIKHWLRTNPSPEPAALPAQAIEPSIRDVLRVVVSGRAVRMSVLRWGQIVIAYDYGDDVRRRIRHLAHRHQGQWDNRYKNWRFNACWRENLEACLKEMHDPSSIG